MDDNPPASAALDHGNSPALRFYPDANWEYVALPPNNAPAEREEGPAALAGANANVPAQKIPLPTAGGRVIEDANGIIDYDNVFGEGMEIEALKALRSAGDGSFIDAFIKQVTLYRIMRQKNSQFDAWIKQSYISMTNITMQIQARLEYDRGGIPYPHINRHPAAMNEKESWRRLPSELISPRTAPQGYSDFVEKFADASAVDIAMITTAITEPLRDVITAACKELPADDYPEDMEECEFQLRTVLLLTQEDVQTEELEITTLTNAAIIAVQRKLECLSKLLQDTAPIRRQIRDASKICERTDPNFNTRTTAQKSAALRQLMGRALDDKVPIHLNPLHNERLWSAAAYTPNKPYLDIMTAEIHRIIVIRNTIARILKHCRTPNFATEEDARCIKELAAFRLTDGRNFLTDGLEPVTYPASGPV